MCPCGLLMRPSGLLIGPNRLVFGPSGLLMDPSGLLNSQKKKKKIFKFPQFIGIPLPFRYEVY